MSYPDDFINKIICGDCLEVMKDIPDKSVDLVLTDPPYNRGFDYGKETDDKRIDYLDWCNSWFNELERISNGAIAISCGQWNLGMWYKIKPPKWIICWWKPASMGGSPVGFANWEPIIFYGKNKGNGGVDVIRAPIIVRKDIGNHPCPKPVEWAKGLVGLLSNENDLILDPFLGSGTTAVACKHLKRNYIGIEISPEYCKIAEERLRQEVLL